MNQHQQVSLSFRPAVDDDLLVLLEIEQRCFTTDRLNRRSFRHWINSDHGILLVAQAEQGIIGYGLVWCHRGTRLARLYSLAIDPAWQGRGLSHLLLDKLEQATAELGYLFMRLEVGKQNGAAIRLYQKRGYRVFGEYHDYYDDHSDALRMQKTIQHLSDKAISRPTPWYRQTTTFSCGPASLMMCMASLNAQIKLGQLLELDVWREATSIFMTSGHGGTHPLGLALAANRRGFSVEVYLNTAAPLFVDGVRSLHKKNLMTVIHQQFMQQVAESNSIDITYANISQSQICQWLNQGCAVMVLISTYRLDGKKAPHWVTVTGYDDFCLYLHDPDDSDPNQQAIDCQYLPISRADFDKMSSFGSGRLRTALAIRPLD